MRLASLSQTLRDLDNKNPRLTGLLFFVAGAALMLSFAPVGWPIVAVLLLQLFFFACLEYEPRRAARQGFWFGAGLFLAGTYWLYISIHVFGQAPLWIAIFLMLGLVVIMGFYYALTAWLIATLSQRSLWSMLLVAPAAWVGVEWLRGWFLSGFPWMTLGYGQIDSPLAGFAPVFGVYGVSFLLVLASAALHVAAKASDRQRGFAIAVAVAVLLSGWSLQQTRWTERSDATFAATIVQGGIEQDRKWLPEQFRPTLNLYRQSLSANPHSKLIVWPEVAIPAVLDNVESYVATLEAELRKNGQTLVFGILERSDGNVHNSVVLLDGTNRQMYRKRHLVPFGETFPVPDFVREWMRLMSLPHSDMTPGAPEQELLKMPDGTQLTVAICYEDAYGAEQLYALPDANVLINVSNDAWFGDSIAPHQHLEIARMRALEAGRMVVRATNTGISAFIGPTGDVMSTLPQFAEASETSVIAPFQGATPYARVGNWPVVVVSLLILAGFTWRRFQ